MPAQASKAHLEACCLLLPAAVGCLCCEVNVMALCLYIEKARAMRVAVLTASRLQ